MCEIGKLKFAPASLETALLLLWCVLCHNISKHFGPAGNLSPGISSSLFSLLGSDGESLLVTYCPQLSGPSWTLNCLKLKVSPPSQFACACCSCTSVFVPIQIGSTTISLACCCKQSDTLQKKADQAITIDQQIAAIRGALPCRSCSSRQDFFFKKKRKFTAQNEEGMWIGSEVCLCREC